MANNLSGRPWVLDTAAATQIVGSPDRVVTLGFTFRDYTSPGDTAVIWDLHRNVIVCKMIGNGGLTPVGEAWQFPGQQILNMALVTLDSGVVEVMVR